MMSPGITIVLSTQLSILHSIGIFPTVYFQSPGLRNIWFCWVSFKHANIGIYHFWNFFCPEAKIYLILLKAMFTKRGDRIWLVDYPKRNLSRNRKNFSESRRTRRQNSGQEIIYVWGTVYVQRAGDLNRVDPDCWGWGRDAFFKISAKVARCRRNNRFFPVLFFGNLYVKGATKV